MSSTCTFSKNLASNSYFAESQYEKSNVLDVNTIKIWVDLLFMTNL